MRVTSNRLGAGVVCVSHYDDSQHRARFGAISLPVVVGKRCTDCQRPRSPGPEATASILTRSRSAHRRSHKWRPKRSRHPPTPRRSGCLAGTGSAWRAGSIGLGSCRHSTVRVRQSVWSTRSNSDLPSKTFLLVEPVSRLDLGERGARQQHPSSNHADARPKRWRLDSARGGGLYD